MVNGQENIFIERHGQLSHMNAEYESRDKLEDVVQ